MDAADDLVAVALLAEPVRQRLYLYLRERREPVGREEAARHAGIGVRLAAFHLDRMADAGLLEFEYRRLSGRVGPGAGRPAKLYSVSSRSFSGVIPQTRYALAASMMATALSAGSAGADGADSLQDVATSVGERLGDDIRRQYGGPLGRRHRRVPGVRCPITAAAWFLLRTMIGDRHRMPADSAGQPPIRPPSILALSAETNQPRQHWPPAAGR